MRDYLFTSESVSEGHPDKVADQISDTVLDYLLEADPASRVACETMVNTGMVVLSGEITSNQSLDGITEQVRNTIKEIGYDKSEMGFDYRSCSVMVAMDRQSQDIAQGVNEGEGIDLDQGAGDQGLMFGYACTETDVLMPMPIHYSHLLVKKQAEVRKSGKLGWLRPDAKSQVTVRYQDGKPSFIDTVVLSTQHDESVSHKDLEEAVIEEVIKPVLPSNMITGDTRYLVNPTGRFVIGGPVGDCGITGRKIIVDTYGGAAHHGGGAFSGKDPSKVDRSAAYAGRYTFGTGKIDEDKIEALVLEHFDLRPKAIIQTLDLLRPIYKDSAAYGHFGRTESQFTWEHTDKAEALKTAAGI